MIIDEFNEHHQEAKKPEPVKDSLLKLDTSNEAYKQTIKNHNACYAAMSKSAENTILEKSERVQIEMQGITGGDIALATFFAIHVYDWYKTKNPYNIDLLFLTCNQMAIEPPPSLVSVMVEVAAARINGDLTGTPDKIIRKNQKQQVYRLMLNLIYSGASLSVAASKAAVWFKEEFPEQKPFKASSLNKDYAAEFRKKDSKGETMESFYFSRWDKYQTEEVRQQWQKDLESLPEADEELKGVRDR